MIWILQTPPPFSVGEAGCSGVVGARQLQAHLTPAQHHVGPWGCAVTEVGDADGINRSWVDHCFQLTAITAVQPLGWLAVGMNRPGWQRQHQQEDQRGVKESGHAPVLVYDGGCLFCSHFAQLSELRSGIPELQIRDGRADHELRAELSRRGAPLRSGAVIICGDQLFHGAEAIEWLCARMQPSGVLLQLLSVLMSTPQRSRSLYPLLLLARRGALALRGLPVDPDSR